MDRFFGWAAALALLGCSGGSHTLLVDVRTDFVPGSELVTVVTERLGELPGAGEVVVREEARRTAMGSDDFILGVRVAELDGLSSGDHVLRVRLLGASGDALMERVAIVTVRADTVVTVVLTRDCRGVTCPMAGSDPEATECVGGRCVAPACLPEAPELCPPDACSNANDCAAPTAGCAFAACVEGTCLAVAESARCPAGQTCHPEEGCMTGGADAGVDGGGVDGGSVDAGGLDAGSLDAGSGDSAVDGGGPACPVDHEVVSMRVLEQRRAVIAPWGAQGVALVWLDGSQLNNSMPVAFVGVDGSFMEGTPLPSPNTVLTRNLVATPTGYGLSYELFDGDWESHLFVLDDTLAPVGPSVRFTTNSVVDWPSRTTPTEVGLASVWATRLDMPPREVGFAQVVDGALVPGSERVVFSVDDTRAEPNVASGGDTRAVIASLPSDGRATMVVLDAAGDPVGPVVDRPTTVGGRPAIVWTGTDYVAAFTNGAEAGVVRIGTDGTVTDLPPVGVGLAPRQLDMAVGDGALGLMFKENNGAPIWLVELALDGTATGRSWPVSNQGYSPTVSWAGDRWAVAYDVDMSIHVVFLCPS